MRWRARLLVLVGPHAPRPPTLTSPTRRASRAHRGSRMLPLDCAVSREPPSLRSRPPDVGTRDGRTLARGALYEACLCTESGAIREVPSR